MKTATLVQQSKRDTIDDNEPIKDNGSSMLLTKQEQVYKPLCWVDDTGRYRLIDKVSLDIVVRFMEFLCGFITIIVQACGRIGLAESVLILLGKPGSQT